MAVYVVSDLHGYYDAFLEGLKKIDLKPSDRLYVIGDAIDRGDDGMKLLLYIKNHKNMDLLIGNHELFMLNSVAPDGKNHCVGKDTILWLYFNGGDTTFEEYAKRQIKTRRNLLAWLRERYVMKTLEVNGRKFCLTHSYYIEGQENRKLSEMDPRDVWSIVWRSMFRDDGHTSGEDIYGKYDYCFVTGHVPVLRVMREFGGDAEYNELAPYRRGNLIDIDGGCAYGYDMGLRNGLIFLRLDDMEVFTVPLYDTIPA